MKRINKIARRGIATVAVLALVAVGMSNDAYAQPCVDEDSLLASFECVDVIRDWAGVRDFGANPGLVIALIINAVLALAGVLAIGAIMAGGVMYITSFGEEEKAKRAKMIILFAVIGLIIILVSAVVTNALINLFR